MWSIIIITILIRKINNSESNKGGIITISSFFSPWSNFEKSFQAILGTCKEGKYGQVFEITQMRTFQKLDRTSEVDFYVRIDSELPLFDIQM